MGDLPTPPMVSPPMLITGVSSGSLRGETQRDVDAMARAPDPGERRENNARGKLVQRARNAFGEGFPDFGGDARRHAALGLREIARAMPERRAVREKLRHGGRQLRRVAESERVRPRDETLPRWRRNFPCADRR